MKKTLITVAVRFSSHLFGFRMLRIRLLGNVTQYKSLAALSAGIILMFPACTLVNKLDAEASDVRCPPPTASAPREAGSLKEDASSTLRIPFDPSNRQKISSTRMVVTQNKRRLKEVLNTEGEPVARRLLELPLAQDFLFQLAPRIADTFWLFPRSLEAIDLEMTPLEDLLSETKTSHLLHIDATIQFCEDLSVLSIECNNVLHPITEDEASKPIYASRTIFHAPLSDAEEFTVAEAARLWMADRRKRLFIAVNQGFRELSGMIYFDLHQTDNQIEHPVSLHGIEGQIMAEGENRVWLRDRKGTLHSLLKN